MKQNERLQPSPRQSVFLRGAGVVGESLSDYPSAGRAYFSIFEGIIRTRPIAPASQVLN
jgi:hypothetical protein